MPAESFELSSLIQQAANTRAERDERMREALTRLLDLAAVELRRSNIAMPGSITAIIRALLDLRARVGDLTRDPYVRHALTAALREALRYDVVPSPTAREGPRTVWHLPEQIRSVAAAFVIAASDAAVAEEGYRLLCELTGPSWQNTKLLAQETHR